MITLMVYTNDKLLFCAENATLFPRIDEHVSFKGKMYKVVTVIHKYDTDGIYYIISLDELY